MSECLNFDRDLIYQLENDIFYNGNEPEQDIENPRFEYGFFVFTKYNNESNVEWQFPDLTDNWQWIGASWLGNWRENQFSGQGPIEKLYNNEMLIRSRLNEYKSNGVLLDFKIRYKYPIFRR
jgi:hypothetical protein